jgi:lysine 2-monooxygenase
MNDAPDVEYHDYVIVGAGVSGAYAFWRLSQQNKDVLLLEMSDRVGGRLYSMTPPKMPSLRAELGGMRFLSSQEFVVALVGQLGLPTSAFPMGGANNIAFLREHFLRDSQFTDPSAIPYFLEPDEQGENPGQILVNAITKIVPNALKYTPQQWETAKQTLMWNGDHIYNWGFWDAIFPTMSSEAYALLLDAGGYESLTDNWNAAEACEHLLADFPSSVSYQRLTNGYQTLPQTLVSQGKAGGYQPGWKLRAMTRALDGKTPVLTLDSTSGPPATRVIMAQNVFLAMPQMALQKLFATSSVFANRSAVDEKIASVTPMPAIKILMGFSSPWWEQLGVSAGRSTTDLPLRQVYYFGQDPQTGNALLMAAYSDGRAESFWRYLIDTALAPQSKFEADVSVVRKIRPLVADVAQSTALQTEVVRQLSIMHNGYNVPQPTWMQLVDWTLPPYGAGWHFWNAGVDVTNTIAGIRQPDPTVPVYICGETYSNEQGWVEGALNSAEHCLQTAWPTIPIPSWLQGIYLGP